MQRRANALRAAGAGEAELDNLWRFRTWTDHAVVATYARFGIEGLLVPNPASLPVPGPVYRRVLRQGPMDGFGYSWFDDHLARAGLTRPRLLDRTAEADGPSFGYEALNLVDGQRSVGEIRDELGATVGVAPVEEVSEYLDTLARLGVLERVGG